MRKIMLFTVILLLMAPLNVFFTAHRSSFVSDTGFGSNDGNSKLHVQSGGRDATANPFDSVFFDDFESGFTNWTHSGVQINQEANNELSPVNAANLDGNGDTLTSNAIDLRGYGFGHLEYGVQPGGGSDPPEVGDDLTAWMNLQTIGWHRVNISKGTGNPRPDFLTVNVALPKTAFHAGFQIRFTTPAIEANADDWYIDNVRVSASEGSNLFFDDFPPNPPDNAKWPVSLGTPVVNTNAQAIPSTGNSLNLDGSGDTLQSGTINLGRVSEAYIFYFWEQGDGSNGNRDEPENMDNLKIEYYIDDPAPLWLEVEVTSQERGGDPGRAFFMLSTFSLPWDALHDNFKFRLHTPQGDNNLDDWFIDDIGLNAAPSYSVPFEDNFDDGQLAAAKWPGGDRKGSPQVNTRGANEPSLTYSLNLDGSGDTVVSEKIDTSWAPWASLTYWWQQGGGGDEPEANDDLIVEINVSSGWRVLKKHLGATAGTNTFTMEEFVLPQDAIYDKFRVKFSTTQGQNSKDDWFIDNVSVRKGKVENPSDKFQDFFESGNLLSNWEILEGNPQINADGQNEPSPSSSLNLDGEGDMISSGGLNLGQAATAVLSFDWQQKGGGDDPENGDDLYADILLMKTGWFNIFQAKGVDQANNFYTNFSFVLPQTALHGNFKVRFRVGSAEGVGKDDWFIDNVLIKGKDGMGFKRVGIYNEYSNKEKEGINPAKALSSQFTDYKLYLFDDYRYAAENLSSLDFFIICEQESLAAGKAGDIHNHWKNSMADLLNYTGRVVVLDGGSGNSRLLVSSFLSSTGHQNIPGNPNVDNDMPNHPISVGIPNIFAGPSEVARFTGVNGREVMTVNNNPVVVEKRYARGSVMLFGLDYSEWNSFTEKLLFNALNWSVINKIQVNKPTIAENDVYAGLPVMVSVDVSDTIGPEDVSKITLEFNDTGVSFEYEDGNVNKFGNNNGTVSLDSWHTGKKVENLTLNLNLTFGWDFPVGVPVDVMVKGYALMADNNEHENETLGLFTVKNEVAFFGTPVAKNSTGDVIPSGGYCKGGDVITLTGIKVVYSGTEDKYPPDEQFDVNVWGDGGDDHWVDMVSSGEEISIEATMPNSGMNNYSFKFNLSGPARANSDPVAFYYVKIDNVTPRLSNPFPEEGMWFNSTNVKCSININDTEQSDDLSVVKCSYSIDGNQTWSNWVNVDSIVDGVAEKTLTLAQGKVNLVKWNAWDRLGNGPIEFGPTPVWIDSEGVEFSDFEPLGKIEDLMPTCTINVSDSLSGVGDQVWVRQSTNGGNTWDDWTQPEKTPNDDGFGLSYRATLQEGSGNRIQWKVEDVAGNVNTSEFKITVDTEFTIPEVELTFPGNGTNTSLRPKLEWSLAKGGAGVNFKLFLSLTADIDTDADTPRTETENLSYTFDEDIADMTTYYWSVIPVKDNDVGICKSGVWSFTAMEGTLPELKLQSPGDSDKAEIRPTLRWDLTRAKEGVKYRVYVSNNSVIDTTNVSGAKKILDDKSYEFVEDLVDGETYYWIVIPFITEGGIDSDGSCLSGVWSFIIDANFTIKWEFDIAVEHEAKDAEFEVGDHMNLTVIITNLGNSLDIYNLSISEDWNYTAIGSLDVADNATGDIKISIVLPLDITLGNHTLVITVTSTGNNTIETEMVSYAIIQPGGVNPHDDTNETGGGFFSDIPMLWIIIAIVVLFLIIVIIVIIVRRRNDDWDDDEDDDDYDDEYDEDEDEEEEDFGRIRKDGASPMLATGAQMEPCTNTNCRKPIPTNTMFCTHCGVKQGQQAETPTTASKPVETEIEIEDLDVEEDSAVTLDELMNRASQLIDTPKKEEPVTETVDEPDIEVVGEVKEDKGLTIDDVTSVDQLLDIMVVESEPFDDDDEDIIEVVATAPLEEDDDEALPLPTVSAASLYEEDDDEDLAAPEPILSIEDVMMEIAGEPDLDEPPEPDRAPPGLAPPAHAPPGNAPPPPPPPE